MKERRLFASPAPRSRVLNVLANPSTSMIDMLVSFPHRHNHECSRSSSTLSCVPPVILSAAKNLLATFRFFAPLRMTGPILSTSPGSYETLRGDDAREQYWPWHNVRQCMAAPYAFAHPRARVERFQAKLRQDARAGRWDVRGQQNRQDARGFRRR